ncbi:MAG: hypothetical protein RSE00_01835 [Clostridia bacterium]
MGIMETMWQYCNAIKTEITSNWFLLDWVLITVILCIAVISSIKSKKHTVKILVCLLPVIYCKELLNPFGPIIFTIVVLSIAVYSTFQAKNVIIMTILSIITVFEFISCLYQLIIGNNTAPIIYNTVIYLIPAAITTVFAVSTIRKNVKIMQSKRLHKKVSKSQEI